MSVPRVLFIPDRYTDYRIWSDIPDRLDGRAEAIHFDQHEQIPWTEANGSFVAAAGRLTADGSFHIVVAASQAVRFGFALAEAGLAKGLALFQPIIPLDFIPDDAEVDTGFPSASEALDHFRPLASAAEEPDPGQQREILLQVLRGMPGPRLEPAELELEAAIASDHAEEIFADLQAALAAVADGRMQPDPPWEQRPWIERLAELTVPLMAVVPLRARFAGDVIASRASHAEIVVAEGAGGLAPADDRARAADALLRMLDRIS
jgi:hypothetical protein